MNMHRKRRPSPFRALALSCLVFSACDNGNESPSDSESSGGSDSGEVDGIDGKKGKKGKKGPKGEEKGDGKKVIPDSENGKASLELSSIRIEPEDRIIRMDLGKEQDVDFKAIAIYTNGEKKDISDKVEWVIERKALGEFDDEVLTLKAQSKFAVKSSKVYANYKNKYGVTQFTLAAYQKSGDSPDFLFVLPYKDKKGKKDSNLRFSTEVPAMDVFFNVDTTMSMKDEIKQLRASLRSTIVPKIKSAVADTQFGVGAFQDFPVKPYGREKTLSKKPDQPFRLTQSITQSLARVESGVGALKLGHGQDVPESAFESLYQISTGEGLKGPGITKVAPNKKGIGGVGFRKGSMPVVVTITDAISHVPGEPKDDGCERDYTGAVRSVAHTRKQTEKALEKVCARVIYVASEGNMTEAGQEHCIPEVDGKSLAKATGARVFPAVWDKNRPKGCRPGQCCTGINGKGKRPEADGRCSLVFNVDEEGNGLGNTVVSGIKALAFYAQFDVTLEKKGERESLDGVKLPGTHTTLDFIEGITADKSGKPPLDGLPKPKASGDHFKEVTPGTEVQFKIKAFNDFLPEKEGEVQVFRAEIKVRADQCEGLALDTREVHFIIPPSPVAPPV